MNENDLDYEHLNYRSPYQHVEYSEPKKYITNDLSMNKMMNNSTNSRFTRIVFGGGSLHPTNDTIIEEDSSRKENEQSVIDDRRRNVYQTVMKGNNEHSYRFFNKFEPMNYTLPVPVNSTLKNKLVDLFFNW